MSVNDYRPQEISYINIVREGGTQADYADDGLA